MTPDRGFVRQLKILDPELEVIWDWGAAKWEIWKFPKDLPEYMVTRIQTGGKDYRELGQDVLLNLQFHLQLGAEKVLDYLEEHNRQLRRRNEKDFRDKVLEMAKDAYGPLFTTLVQVPETFKVEDSKLNKILEVI